MSTKPHTARHSIFGMPILIGTASLVGLVVGLLGDGLLDLVSWSTLGVSVVAIGWALVTRRR